MIFKDKDNKQDQLETVKGCISSFRPPSRSLQFLLSSQPSHTFLSCVSVLCLPFSKPILQLPFFAVHWRTHTHASTHTRAQDSRDFRQYCLCHREHDVESTQKDTPGCALGIACLCCACFSRVCITLSNPIWEDHSQFFFHSQDVDMQSMMA